MSGDVCDCGLCDVDVCDLCGGHDGLRVHDDCEVLCRSCFENYEQMQNEQMAERELSAWHGGDDWMGGEAYRRQMREAGR